MCLFCFLSCSKTKKTDVFTFQFYKQATLIVKSNPNNNEHSIVGRYLTFLPPDYINNYKFADTLNVNNTDDLILSFKISSPTEASLIIDEYLWLPVFLVPDDTLYMSLDLSDSSKIVENIRFDGKYASINEYRIRRFENFRESFEDKCAELGRNDLSVMELQNAIDSVETIELSFLNNYIEENSLPKWFIEYERNQINYRAAFDKTYKIINWKWNNTEKEVPINYYGFIKNIKINNEDALISPYYYYFLWQYFSRFLPNEIYKMDVSERRKIVRLKLFEISDSLLTGEVKDVFRTLITSQLIIDQGMYSLAEDKIIEQKSRTNNLKYVNYLENYLKDKLTLKSGVNAPEFYLQEISSEFKSLNDYKGNMVLLNFWFPGCMPCISEIPFERKLVDDLQNEKFILINICLFSSEENWRKTIYKFEMKGEHLFANVSWQNKLVKEYKLSSYPHYTLIDKKGKVISNNPKRPSEGIKEEILKLLNN
jgi:thiol-disulfide isomerase/thioredoxin